jgi:hypothetical protein
MDGDTEQHLLIYLPHYYYYTGMYGRCWFAEQGAPLSGSVRQASVLVGGRQLEMHCSASGTLALPSGAMMLAESCPVDCEQLAVLPPGPSVDEPGTPDPRDGNSRLHLCRLRTGRNIALGDVLLGGTETSSWRIAGSGGYLHSMMDLDMWSPPKLQWGRQVNSEWLVGAGGRYMYTGSDPNVERCMAMVGESADETSCDATMARYCRGDGRMSEVCSCFDSEATEHAASPVCIDPVCRDRGWKPSSVRHRTTSCQKSCESFLAKNTCSPEHLRSTKHPCAMYLKSPEDDNNAKSINGTRRMMLSSSSLVLLLALLIGGAVAAHMRR